jgi:ankyrin repeat protein
MLANNTRLTYLDVSDNELGGIKLDNVLVLSKGADGLQLIAEALARNQTLLYLNMLGNNIGKFAMKAFGEMLAKNRTLSRFLIGDLEVNDQLESGLRKNLAVTELGYDVQNHTLRKYRNRNLNHREEFLNGLNSGYGLGKLRTHFEKGVDFLSTDPTVGSIHLIGRLKNDEVARFCLENAAFSNYFFANARFFSVLPKLPGPVIKAFAQNEQCAFYAALKGEADILDLLLKHGADLYKMDPWGRTVLTISVENGHANVVDYLLRVAKYNIHNGNGEFRLPLLLLAAKNGAGRVVRILLKHHPELLEKCSAPPKKRSALHVASKSGRAEACEVLMELGADPNDLSGDGVAPIHLAANPEVFKVLTHGGADPKLKSSAGKDALFYAFVPEDGGETKLSLVNFLLEEYAEQLDKRATFDTIETLDLRNQFRDSLPSWVGKLKNLKELKAVEGNSLKSVPRNVVKEGDTALLNYLRDMASGTKDWWKGFKVLVLGKEGVGKTHIFHLASGNQYDRDASTDGIDIHRFSLSSAINIRASTASAAANAEVPVTWFDFGGQV